jgi:hypothetical protein
VSIRDSGQARVGLCCISGVATTSTLDHVYRHEQHSVLHVTDSARAAAIRSGPEAVSTATQSKCRAFTALCTVSYTKHVLPLPRLCVFEAHCADSIQQRTAL